jgi:hypothetical protein
MEQSNFIIGLYSALMFLMITAMPLIAIMSIIAYLTRKAKQGYREITK